jgi:hypothetical protein
MTISSTRYTVGTATIELAAPSVDPQRVTITNLQPEPNAESLARDGYVFVAADRFTISNNGTAHLQITTGEHGAQIQFYEIVASSSAISAELIEGATFGSATAVPSYNLNRNSSRVASSTLSAATAVSGGTVISEEFVPASNQSAGGYAFTKIHTLEPSTSYVMRFIDVGGNGATAFLQLGFAEQYDGDHDVHLNNSAGSAWILAAGQTFNQLLYASESINARTESQECDVAVLRQVQQ